VKGIICIFLLEKQQLDPRDNISALYLEVSGSSLGQDTNYPE
jgi:hypothetical protein